MKGLRIDEAIKKCPVKITRTEVAVHIWPDVDRNKAAQYLSAVTLGKNKKLSPDQMRKLCEILHCSADFLLRLE